MLTEDVLDDKSLDDLAAAGDEENGLPNAQRRGGELFEAGLPTLHRSKEANLISQPAGDRRSTQREIDRALVALPAQHGGEDGVALTCKSL